jgi:superfamily II DNA helicase RecQ
MNRKMIGEAIYIRVSVQLKSEQKEIIQNVLERKDSMAVLPTGFGKSMCYIPPSHFGQGKDMAK